LHHINPILNVFEPFKTIVLSYQLDLSYLKVILDIENAHLVFGAKKLFVLELGVQFWDDYFKEFIDDILTILVLLGDYDVLHFDLALNIFHTSGFKDTLVPIHIALQMRCFFIQKEKLLNIWF
jgi:hypothetical protein